MMRDGGAVDAEISGYPRDRLTTEICRNKVLCLDQIQFLDSRPGFEQLSAHQSRWTCLSLDQQTTEVRSRPRAIAVITQCPHHRLSPAASSCRLARSFLCLTGEIACLMQKPQHENAGSIHAVEDNVSWVTGPTARVACLEVTGADALPEVGALVASDAQRVGADINQCARDQIGVARHCVSAEPKCTVVQRLAHISLRRR